MSLQGKGWFIWQIPRCEGGNPQAIADLAASTGTTHVLIKVAERTFGFGYDAAGKDLVPPVADALRARGIQVWGWHYIYGQNPIGEANIAIKRTTQLKLDGYIIDAEKEFKAPGMAAPARTYIDALRAGLPNTLIALSSYRYPSLHQELPWAVFLEKCDLNMPQVYWEMSHNPDAQLARSVSENSNPKFVGYARPIVATGAAYAVGDWRPTGDEITKFYAKAVSLGLAAANLFTWDYARKPAYLDLWDAASRFQWPGVPGPQPGPVTPPVSGDLLTRYFTALNSGDANQVIRLYQPNAGHVTPKRTVVGASDIAKWYYDLLGSVLRGATFTMVSNEGDSVSKRFKWTAAGPTGTVADGDDTLGIRDGLIQYHYTYFNFRPR